MNLSSKKDLQCDTNTIPVKNISLKDDINRIKQRAATIIQTWIRGFLVRHRISKCIKEIQKFNRQLFLFSEEELRKTLNEY